MNKPSALSAITFTLFLSTWPVATVSPTNSATFGIWNATAFIAAPLVCAAVIPAACESVCPTTDWAAFLPAVFVITTSASSLAPFAAICEYFAIALEPPETYIKATVVANSIKPPMFSEFDI